MEEIEFQEFPKIHRLNRTVVVTEKIDGTNAQVIVTEDGRIAAASRTRIITPGNDNFGFAAWVEENKEELLKLGPGRHFGEWWGKGIQRGYGLNERRFSLFNVGRWKASILHPEAHADYANWASATAEPPSCCHVVPLLAVCESPVSERVGLVLYDLRRKGSLAAPGFTNPEGIVLFHEHSRALFKFTLDGDGHKHEEFAKKFGIKPRE